MSNIEKETTELMEKANSIIEEYGGVVAEKTLRVAQLEALQTLITGTLAGVIFFLAVLSGYKLYQKYKKINFDSFIFGELVFMGGIVNIFVAVISFLFFTNLFDIINWVGLFDPATYLIHEKIMN